MVELNLATIYTRSKSGLDIYLYTTNNVLIPRFSKGLYGSFMKKIKVTSNTSYFFKFYIRMNNLFKVDRIGQRCIGGETQESVGHCLVRYLEELYNCTSYHLAANKSKPFCNREKTSVIVDALESWKGRSETELSNETGCLPHCERHEVSLEESPDSRSWMTSKPTLTMSFMFEDGSYQLEEEYIIYDVDSFIADVGGFLGILLRVLSFYYLLVEWSTMLLGWLVHSH